MKKIGIFLLALVLGMSVVSAISVNSIQSGTFSPGVEGTVRVEIENTLNDNVEDISFRLILTDLPFIPVGSSERSVDELGEGEEEDFSFKLRPAYDIRPGDYQIPYEIRYSRNGDDVAPRTGFVGVSVRAQPELSFSLDEQTPVVGSQGSLTLRIVNDGLADARFVSVKVTPEGYTLLSDNEAYVGTIDSDDFETATFDVRFTKEHATFRAIVEYRDIDNERIIERVSIPFNVYTKERAVELGIIQNSSWQYYIGIVVLVVILWFGWRMFRKRRRMRAAQQRS